MVFNSLIDLRQRVRQAWSLVDVQLQRRHDLIPNLVNAVKGYSDYEKQLQPELAALRGELLATPPGVTGPDFSGVAKTAVAIAERYPDLKANTTFTALQKNLIDTEQRIALGPGLLQRHRHAVQHAAGNRARAIRRMAGGDAAANADGGQRF